MSVLTPFLWASAGWALVYWVFFARSEETSWAKSVIKTLPVLTLALAGVLWLVFANPEAGFWVIPFGLALGALGDFLLSRPGTGAFLGGMAAFAAGHLAYISGFLARSGSVQGTDWLVVAGLIALVLSTEGWLAPRTGDLRWPVRLYGLVIGLMGFAALRFHLVPEAHLAKIGAGLFILSDLLLALRLFVWTTDPRSTVLSLLLWPAYWGGQLLILLGSIGLWPSL